jgi:hypothetical protein
MASTRAVLPSRISIAGIISTHAAKIGRSIRLNLRNQSYKFFILPLVACLATARLPASEAKPGASGKRSPETILLEIAIAKSSVHLSKTHALTAFEQRLVRGLNQLHGRLTVIAAQKRERPKTQYATLWSQLRIPKPDSAKLDELLLRTLEIPIDDLLKELAQTGLLIEVLPSSHGCCAIEGYYRVDQTEIARLPDDIVLALRVRLPAPTGRAARGLYHGSMVELVNRGYYESYNGYQCGPKPPNKCKFDIGNNK